MKGTKKFYKELLEEIRFHENEIKRIKEKKQISREPSIYDIELGYHEGAMRATRMICYKIYPACELDKDLKQGL